MFSFVHPFYLVYLLLLPIIFLWLLLQKRMLRKKLRQFADENLQDGLFTKNISTKIGWRWYSFLAGMGCLLIAMASPRLSGVTEEIKVNGRQILFCLDVSNSMNAKDIAPNRLERGKLLIRKIIEQNQGQNFGLVLFAGKATLAVPISEDITTLFTTLSAVNTDIISTQGTSIADALNTAKLSFQEKLDGGKMIFLLSDGEDHNAGIDEIIAQLNDEEIPIFSLGLGSERGEQVLDAQNGLIREDNGEVAISKLSEATLKKIASGTSGAFFNIDEGESVHSTMNNIINGLENGTQKSANHKNYQQLFIWPLALGMLLIFMYFLPQKQFS
jgi:Ca-activated chloride channel homolog